MILFGNLILLWLFSSISCRFHSSICHVRPRLFYHLKISHEIRLWMNYLCNKCLLPLQQTSFILFPGLVQNWEFIYIEVLYWFIVMFYFYVIGRRTENVYINQMLPGDIYICFCHGTLNICLLFGIIFIYLIDI